MAEDEDNRISVREYFERILLEQREALRIAESERENAARIARDSMHVQFQAADTALERHIAEQVQQVRQVIDLNGKAVEAALATSEKAIQKAENATEKRFDSVNGFQKQLTVQAATFATREGVESTTKQLSALIERNREDLAEQRGVYLRVAAFDVVLSELATWRTKVDVRDAEQQNSGISRRALDDILSPITENVSALQKWQFKIIGALVFIAVILPGLVALAVYLMTRQTIPVAPMSPAP